MKRAVEANGATFNEAELKIRTSLQTTLGPTDFWGRYKLAEKNNITPTN